MPKIACTRDRDRWPRTRTISPGASPASGASELGSGGEAALISTAAYQAPRARTKRAGCGKRPICFVGALGRTLNVQGVRLACGLRAPPRIWTFLRSLRVFSRLLVPRLRNSQTREPPTRDGGGGVTGSPEVPLASIV